MRRESKEIDVNEFKIDLNSRLFIGKIDF